MTEKIKFSGMSYPDGTTIYGKKYGVQIDKDGYKIIKKGTGLFIYLYPFIDIFMIGAWFGSGYINAFVSKFISPASMNIAYVFINELVSAYNGSLYTWIGAWIIVGIIGFYFYRKFKDILFNVAQWHGCEHKIIDAAEKNSIDNANQSSTVNLRCGSTYVTSNLTAMALWMMIVKTPIGIPSLIFLIMYFESSTWHDKNLIGIKIGSWLQKKALTREPTPEMLEMGKRGISALMVRERNG